MIVPGIAGMAVLATTFSALAYNMVFLREQGILKRMRGTPLPSRRLPARDRRQRGHEHRGADRPDHASPASSSTASTGRGTSASWCSSSSLGVLCFASLGVALAHAIPNFEAATVYVNLIFLPVVFISIDAAHDPRFLKGIAEALPLKHLIDGLSGAMVTGEGSATTSRARRARAVDGARRRARDPRLQLGAAPRLARRRAVGASNMCGSSRVPPRAWFDTPRRARPHPGGAPHVPRRLRGRYVEQRSRLTTFFRLILAIPWLDRRRSSGGSPRSSAS